MKVIFERIRWKNLLSTGNVWTDILLNKDQTTLFLGKNGAGKSTLLDALSFVLFNKSFRGLPLPLLINSINEKECIVEIEFVIGSKKFKIERGMKPDIFNIYENGVLLNKDAAKKDYQRYLETHILKFNHKACMQIVILGKASFEPFMKLDAADRRAIIEDLLDIEIFSSMNDIVKSKVKDLKIQIDDNKIKLDSTSSKIDLQKKYVEEAKKSSTELIEAKKSQLLDEEVSLTNFMSQAVLKEQDVATWEYMIQDEQKVTDELKKLQNYYNRIDLKKAAQEKVREFYVSKSSCPTCHQDIQHDFKDQKILDADREIKSYKDALDQMDERMDKLSFRLEEIKVVKNRINHHKSEITTLNASATQVEKHMKVLEAELEAIRNKKVLSDDMLEVSANLLKDLEFITNERKELTELKKYYDVAATLLKDTGIKTKIIKQYLPVINKMINKYLSSMDSFVNFELDEEFKETIKSRHRDNFRYENFSEGEKMKIDLALLFTWRDIARLKNSMSTNLLVLDEIFDSSLDSEATEAFFQLLELLKDNTNVFVISPKGEPMADKFKNVVRFEKNKGFSSILNNEG